MKKEGVLDQASQIFRQAANYIRMYGWQKDGMGTYGQPRCSMGAIASVYPAQASDELPKVMYEALYTELNGRTLTKFNQEFDDGEKVARLFEQVAARLRVLT